MRFIGARIIAAACLMLAAAAPARATPMYYQLSGSIDTVQDGAGAAAASGIAVGTQLSYWWAIDLAAAGYETIHGAAGPTLADDGVDVTEFWAERLTGPLMAPAGGVAPLSSGIVADYDYGADHPTFSRLYDGSDKQFVEFTSNQHPAAWNEGASLRLFHRVYDSAGNHTEVKGWFTILAIRTDDPTGVPEPASLALVGLAAAAVVTRARRCLG